MKKDWLKILFTLSAFFSIIAIILSQFPPIYTWNAKSKIETTLNHNGFNIFHNMGYLFFENYIKVTNTGTKKETITKICFYIKKLNDVEELYINKLNGSDELFEKTLTIQTYFDYSLTANFNNGVQYPIHYPFLDTYLFPDESWFSRVLAYRYLDKQEQIEYDSLIYNISEIIEMQEIEYIDDSTTKIYKPIAFYDSIKNKTKELIDKNLMGFTIGEYLLLLFPFDKNGKPITPDRYYTFKVYPEDIIKLNTEICNHKRYKWHDKYDLFDIYNETSGFSTTLEPHYDKVETKKIIKKLKEKTSETLLQSL